MSPSNERPILPWNFLADRIMLRSLMTPDMDDIAIAGGCDHAGHGTVVFQYRIGADRCAMQYVIDPVPRHIEASAELAYAGDNAVGRIVLCRRRLVDQGPAGLRIGEHDIRERAADIYADQVHQTALPASEPNASRWRRTTASATTQAPMIRSDSPVVIAPKA